MSVSRMGVAGITRAVLSGCEYGYQGNDAVYGGEPLLTRALLLCRRQGYDPYG